MRRQQFKRWQVLLGIILFLALMGIVGKIDQDSQQAVLDEKTAIRDQLQAAVEADANMWTTYYINRGGGVR